VGAGALAVSPIAPPPADIQIPNPAVQLAANPLGLDTQLFDEALANVTGLLDAPELGDLLSGPLAPLLEGFLNDPTASFEDFVATFEEIFAGLQGAGEALPALLQGVFDDLTAGDVETAVNTIILAVVATVLPVATALLVPVLGAVGIPEALAPLLATAVVLGLAGPLISGSSATGAALQDVIDGLEGGDPAAIVGALIGAPATIINGVVNGGTGPDLRPALPVPLNLSPIPVVAGGLLRGAFPTGTVATGPLRLILPGTFPTLQAVTGLLLGLLNPPAVTSLTEVPTTERLVTLDVIDVSDGDEADAAGDVGAVAIQQAPTGGSAEETEEETVVEDVKVSSGETDLTNGNKFVPGSTVTNSGGQGGTGLGAIRDGFRSTVQGFGDAVRNLTGLGRGDTGGTEDSAGDTDGSGTGDGSGAGDGS
jgi:hypothetical protein